MSGLIVAFYTDGSSHSGRHRLLFDFFVIQAAAWANLFDHLYLVDSGWRLTHGDKVQLHAMFSEVHIISRPPTPHWDNIRLAIDAARADGVDIVAIIDSDTIVYDGGLLAEKLDHIRDGLCDVAAITDGSGGYKTWEEFPQFAANQKRAHRRRLAPYLLLSRRALLDGLRFDPLSVTTHGDNWMDSFGQATLEIMRQGARLEEIEDDRCSLYLDAAGEMSRSTNLDGPPYTWSVPLERRKYVGAYHVRNFGAAIRWLDTFYTNRAAFDAEAAITPPTEFFRLLGWCWALDYTCNTDDTSMSDDILAVVEHVGMSLETWFDYVDQWAYYHDWLVKLWKV